MKTDPSTIERLVPWEIVQGDVTGQETLNLHYERYRFAARNLRPGRLLDMACGVGYGTRLMCDGNPTVVEAVGVDLSPQAIANAKEKFGRDKLRYVCADAMTFEDREGFDSIVSLETIEHVPDPVGLTTRLFALLRPGGRLIASVPVTPSADVNPHHLHDFTAGSFRRMLQRHALRELDAFVQVQPYRLFKTLRREEQRMQDMRANLPAYYLTHPWRLAKRLGSTLRYGFTNRYLTCVLERVE